jgi:hypothetical protein
VAGLTAKRKWLQAASVLILIVATSFLAQAVEQHWAEVPEIRWTQGAVYALLGTIVLVLFNLGLGGLMWKALLKDQGVVIPVATSFQIVGMSQVGKYLPGNIGHLVGQVGLAKDAGIPVGVSLAAMLVSTLWLVATGLAVGGAGLLVFLDAQNWLDLPVPHPAWSILKLAGFVQLRKSTTCTDEGTKYFSGFS